MYFQSQPLHVSGLPELFSLCSPFEIEVTRFILNQMKRPLVRYYDNSRLHVNGKQKYDWKCQGKYVIILLMKFNWYDEYAYVIVRDRRTGYEKTYFLLDLM